MNQRLAGIITLLLVLISSTVGKSAHADEGCASFSDCFSKARSASSDPDKQVDYFSLAIQRWSPSNGNNNLAIAYYNRGNIYGRDKGLYDEAIRDYNRALELRPDYQKVYTNRGNAYKKKGLYDEAIRDYNRALELKPDDYMAYNNRGNAYREKGLYDEAFRDYNKSIELKSDYALAYKNRGKAYEKKGLPDLAERDFKRAEELKKTGSSTSTPE